MAYTIYCADNCAFTKVPSLIMSGKASVALPNGALVVVGGLVSGQREVFTLTVPVAATDKVAIVTTPELIYDETPRKGLADFVNAANSISRVCVINKGDIWRVTVEAFVAAPTSTNKYIAATAGATTYTASSSATNAIAEFIGSEVRGGVTFYALKAL